MTRVHLADDDPGVRQMVTCLMAEEGYEVSCSKDGEEALRSIVINPPDLLILDMIMPRMDGYGVLNALATSGLRERTRVLVLTAMVTEQDRESILELGVDYHMTKPFDADELCVKVGELLALPQDELIARRQREKDTTHLLSQLESLFDGT